MVLQAINIHVNDKRIHTSSYKDILYVFIALEPIKRQKT